MSDPHFRIPPRVEDKGLFERIIRTDEKAIAAHDRLDRHDDAIEQIGSRIGAVEAGVNELKVSVSSLYVKVSIGAALGSLIGGGAIAVLVALLLRSTAS